MINANHLVLCLKRMMKSDVKKTMTPSPTALIISMTIPESPAALPDFILLIALDTISGVILIAGPSTGAASLILTAFQENLTCKGY